MTSITGTVSHRWPHEHHKRAYDVTVEITDDKRHATVTVRDEVNDQTLTYQLNPGTDYEYLVQTFPTVSGERGVINSGPQARPEENPTEISETERRALYWARKVLAEQAGSATTRGIATALRDITGNKISNKS
ncbi:MAG: hypothetical protein ABH823_03165 [bacterium]